MSNTEKYSSGYLDGRAKLRGKNAVVVGGGGGIGAAVSLALAAAGVNLAICDKDNQALAATLTAALEFDIKALGKLADVRTREELDTFFGEVSHWAEEIDILVNVAGGTKQRSFLGSGREQDDEDIRLNFGYILDSIRHTAPKMPPGSSIINFTTIEAHRGAANFATYAGAKAATTNLSRTLAVELGPAGIRVNCVAPDTTPSAGNGQALPPEKAAAVGNLPPRAAEIGLKMYIPLKSAPDVAALANAVLFLASDLSAFVTGTTLHVDGGTWAASGFLDWPEGDGFLPVPMAGTLARLVD